MRYTVSLQIPDPQLLFNYNRVGGMWGWTSIFDRVDWLTLEDAKQFIADKREYAATYIIMDEDQVRSLLVARELAGADGQS